MGVEFSLEKTIQENFYLVKEKVERAARQAGRNPEDVKLIVVTKTKPSELIKCVIEAGALDFGENYVEEAVPKIQTLANYPGLRWHMIGHLQSRKARDCCEYFHCLHSLDSLKLAERVNRFCVEIGKTLPVYLEFNVSGEDTKSGWDIQRQENWGNILPDIEHILRLPNLNVLGMMTMPPYSDDAEASRPYFQSLRKFQDYVISHLQLVGYNELSIGMSSDFDVAIQEGSTCVRIGQAILGPRVG
ncbi:MAG: YggS family pyridoxal phosphate-dependent enzyme [Anaerolineales bacterium]|nr:YggS family pyridoxal phosphate-dependent enzyme [Anaerolineae bacterium]PWB50854.1 MAG: YggS family pyridoxal phosphate-dependent enzyme [Anaerolineales bacterium]